MDDVVPDRPDFGSQFRGFNRTQVVEYIEQLESKLRCIEAELASADGDERTVAEDENGDFAEHRAAVIIEQAEAQAAELIRDAERVAERIRADCTALAGELYSQRGQVHREQARNARELHEREHRLRRNVQREYKRITAIGERDAAELLERTRQRCVQRDAESEELRRRVLDEIDQRHTETQRRQQEVCAAIDVVLANIGRYSTELCGLITPAGDTDGVEVRVETNGNKSSTV
ncbi:hypothetical protein MOQ72_21095 [Saccharopolyspora sp. K220]|uniref:hypothetical protein n=1 Tax=Saccharopolyspora soli TaxID=2926618 RepID=UPI001F5744B7|nr:hypothetical protein [Saccharopolyspora soli]MCI2419947.1 hypothetical protein [Saccharopolyspora soli]